MNYFWKISYGQIYPILKQIVEEGLANDKHLTAWRNFNKKIGNNDAVGIYHETYIVPKTNHECLYGNMPIHGLAKAAGHQLVTPALNSARKRLKA